jgi:gamma-glutamyl hercynylcysteine S-oxide synthase
MYKPLIFVPVQTKPMKSLCFLSLSVLIILTGNAHSQSLKLSSGEEINVIGYTDRNGKSYRIPKGYPLVTYLVDGKSSGKAEIAVDQAFEKGWKCTVTISNDSDDTIDIENIVPFGETPDHIYLTSTGPWALARAKIFRPGLGPVGVILPDNAWELGYACIPLSNDLSLCAIARRTKSENAEWRRYRTLVFPGGFVEYTLWADEYNGEWQNGLKLMFSERYLYDLESFEDSLYLRDDLHWIRHTYLIGLQFAWNQEFFDWKKQEYTVEGFLQRGRDILGGYDIVGLWPTWPRLGVDQRNQWDLFNDLPGGLPKLKGFSGQWKADGTKFFICYNPWDESTRAENPYEGMARLIEATDADGVVLDCHGASSYELQSAADRVKPGVIMYSEGMAVIRDMPGIVAGRVHDAIVLPPPLNLNKLIKPEFAIFRVCQLHDGRIRREASIAFFNGYGTELNTFAPGRFENMTEDLLYLGMTTRLLRENTSNFLVQDWTPLLPTLADSIWVNKWPTAEKIIFTVFSLIPAGFNGPLFEEQPLTGKHLVSLWHHEELDWIEKDGKYYIPVKAESFNSYELDTRAEGNIDCIALLPKTINASVDGNKLLVDAGHGDEIRVWAGIPSYQNEKVVVFPAGSCQVNIPEKFGEYEGKLVVQLFRNDELLDEKVITFEPGMPRLAGPVSRTGKTKEKPEGMVFIPAGPFRFRAENTDQFIPYPETKEPVIKYVTSFYMDEYPVTNRQYAEFIKMAKYRPVDTTNYLKHWINGHIPPGLDDHPVVYISLEDARAYAGWAGKRLPTEVEWQYAAGGRASLKWPWGNEFDSTFCNNALGNTTPVSSFPEGASPFGVMDLVGNVWQMTGDVYDNGTYYFVIMKGGSFYKPTSSWWYVKGGPQPNNWHQQLLLVSSSFDRNATVGFRCVMDVSD